LKGIELLRIALNLTLFILVTGKAFAAHAACPFQNDSKEEKLCISNQVDLAEKMMVTYLFAAKEAVENDDSLMQQISDSQAAWVTYRKEQCDNDLLWARLEKKPYSFRSAMQCQLDLTKSRSHDIWAAYLSRSSATPILPEPLL
jgi:uncharacterized protein YecT (DUF1311 family)